MVWKKIKNFRSILHFETAVSSNLKSNLNFNFNFVENIINFNFFLYPPTHHSPGIVLSLNFNFALNVSLKLVCVKMGMIVWLDKSKEVKTMVEYQH